MNKNEIRDNIYKLRLAARLEIDSDKRKEYSDKADKLAVEYKRALFDEKYLKNGGRKK